MSTEELAVSICDEWPRVVADHFDGMASPTEYLREKLDGLSPVQACLVGVRLAQSMGTLQASLVFALKTKGKI